MPPAYQVPPSGGDTGAQRPQMTLELSKLMPELQAMGKDLAARGRRQADLVEMARRWLREYGSEYGVDTERLRHPARAVRAAIPTHEPIDAIVPTPAAPEHFTVIGVDGSQVEPDRHGVAFFYLVNVGSLVYRHGSGQAPKPRSQPTLGYTEDDIYEDGMPVVGNLLDLRRDLAEITQAAELCESEARDRADDTAPGPVVALVDGTLLLWVLEDRSVTRQRAKVGAYLDRLERIRQTGAAVSAFTSRPRHTDVTRLLHLASVSGDVDRARREPNQLERVPDRAIFETLPAGARSALFLSPSPTNHQHYAPAGQAIHFCYLNVAEEERDAAIARLEMPSWVSQDPNRLGLVHGAIVVQARIAGDYPYALARADELAFISGQEREMFTEMVTTALLRAGVRSALSPKAYQKALTRGSTRKRR